jgi:hypothetical protein
MGSIIQETSFFARILIQSGPPRQRETAVAIVKRVDKDGVLQEDLGEHNIPTTYRVGAWIYLTVNGLNGRYKVAQNDPGNNIMYVEADPLPAP